MKKIILILTMMVALTFIIGCNQKIEQPKELPQEDGFLVKNFDGTYNLSFDDVEEVVVELYAELPTYLPVYAKFEVIKYNKEYLIRDIRLEQYIKEEYNTSNKILNSSYINDMNRGLNNLNFSEYAAVCDEDSEKASDKYFLEKIFIKGMKNGKEKNLTLESYSVCYGFFPWNIFYDKYIFTNFGNIIPNTIIKVIDIAVPDIRERDRSYITMYSWNGKEKVEFNESNIYFINKEKTWSSE